MNLLPRISPLQLFIICFNAAIGVTMITLPRSVAQVASEDMWLSVLIGGVSFLFSVWIAARLAGYFPECTCIEYHCILLGPILGQIANIVLLSIMVMIPVVSLRTFEIALKMFLLDITPHQIIIVVLLLLAVYASQYGLTPLMRLQQFIFTPNYFMFIILLLLGVMAVDTRHYQPLLAEGLSPVAKGAIPSWFSYTGPEFVIGLTYPFLTRQKYTLQWGAASIAALTALYTLITVIVQGILGPKVIAHMMAPTIIAYRSVEIPDTFIERVDGYLMIVWIPIVFIFLSNFFYLISFGAARILKLENSRPVTVLLVPLFYYLISVPPNIQTAMAVSNFVNMAVMVWGLGILPLLLVLAWLKEKRRKIC